MKFASTVLFALAVWIAGRALLAQAGTETNQPYQVIISRNVFGLVPAPPQETLKPPTDEKPPPRITLCGTTSILGRPQALFRVAGIPKPGVTARETSHLLGVGEEELGVKVVKISKDGSFVTFNNHGIIQVLQLKAPPAPWKPAETPAVFSGPIPEHFGSDLIVLRRMRP